MPLPEPTARRKRLHRRRIQVEGFEREDGLWDIEGYMCDTKDYGFELRGRHLPAGAPLHEMRLRITINDQLEIVDAVAAMDAVPFWGTCETVAPDYHKLVGLRIAPGFKKAVNERLGGTKGCTHVSELLGPMATTAFQTLSGYRRANGDPERRPFQLDGCRGWDSRGQLVREYYPRWYRGAGEETAGSGS
jgi:hypothetical protein